MSFDSQEKSVAGGRPFELFLFTGTGLELALTSADTTVDHAGHTFTPASISRTEVDINADVQQGDITVSIDVTDPVAQLFIGGLPPTPVFLTIFAGFQDDAERSMIFSGECAASQFTEDQVQITCHGDQYVIQRRIPKILYQSACPLIFGGKRCGFDLSQVTYLGVVASVSADGLTVVVTAFGSLPHSLRAGTLSFGAYKRMIVKQTGTSIVLLAAIPGLVAGSHVIGVAGCQQTFSACVEYNNIDAFLGYDLIPTINPFNGAIT